MKKAIITFLIISSCISVLKAQTSEFSVQANTGLSHFLGTGTLNSTFLNADGQQHTGYPNGSGNKNAVIFGGNIQWQYTFKCNFLLGLQAGYEALGSKINISSVYSEGVPMPATGSFTEHLNYINLNPFIGYRFDVDKVHLDVMPGLDIALGLNSKLTGKAVTNNNVVYSPSSVINGKPDDDVRIRLGLAAYYQRFGIIASYSRGLADFNSGEIADAPVPAMHLEAFRLGISYQIK